MNIIESNLAFKNTLSALGTVNKITIHHAEAITCSIYDIHQWHLNNGWSGCGYHFFIRKDGSIYRGRPENKLGAHVSNKNSNNIGICFEGSFMKETMTSAQLKAGQELVKYLMNKYNLRISDVYKHKDLQATDCPGTNFPWNSLINGVTGATGSITTTTATVTSSNNVTIAKNYLKTAYQIKLVQLILNSLSYSLTPDGICGSKTAGAIYQFQYDNGLDKDYKFGPKCFEKAYDYLKIKVFRVGRTAEAIKIFQHVMGIAADGVFGTETKRNVISYQLEKNLEADGIVGATTWAYYLGVEHLL